MASRGKRIKTGLLLAGVFALIAVGAIGSFVRPELEADRVVEARFGDVEWSHQMHARMREIANCQVCHHKERQGTARPRPCRECHKPQSQDAVVVASLYVASEAVEYQGENGPPPMTAFHGKCVGCHKAMAKGPVGCRDCHEQSFTGEHGRVTWDHRAHARSIDMGMGEMARNCLRCHHQDEAARTDADYRPCDRCHRPAKVIGMKMESGIKGHEDVRHGECARCHSTFNPEVDDARTCKDCHAGMEVDTEVERPAIEQAVHQRCMECHNEEYGELTEAMPVRCNDCHKPDPSVLADLGVGLIMWDHDRHARFGGGMSCDKCHHTDLADQPHMACSRCHGTGLYENPTVGEALRQRCLGCHEEEENGLVAWTQLTTDREQVDVYEYKGPDGAFHWDHRDHAVAWSFSCRNCHHNILRDPSGTEGKEGQFVMAARIGGSWDGKAIEVQSCRNCHGASGPVAGSPAQGSKAPSFDGAFEKLCLECHQKLGGGPQRWEEFFAVEPVELAPAAEAPTP